MIKTLKSIWKIIPHSYFRYTFIVLTCAPFLLKAQNNLKIEQLSQEDGFSYRWVMSFHQDSKGMMWFGTYDGLNRYDGNEFVIFKHRENDSTTLVNNIVDGIEEASDGQLWLSSPDGISIYDRTQNQFRKAQPGTDFINHSPQDVRTINSQFLHYLPELKSYFFKSNFPDSKINHNKDSYYELLKDENTITKNVVSITKNSEESLWFWLTNGNYLQYNIQQSTWRYFDLKSEEGINTVHQRLPVDKQGRFWYPSHGGHSEKFDSFAMPDGIAIEDWIYYKVDNYQNIWFKNIENKLFAYDINQKELKYFGIHDEDLFYQDKEGTRWLGSEAGVKKIVESKQLFENYFAKAFELGEILPIGMSTREIAELNTGEIALRQDHENRFYLIDPAQQTTSQISLNIDKQTNNAVIQYMVVDKDDHFWFNIPEVGLIQYDIKSDTSIFFPLPSSTPFLIEDNRDRLWRVFEEDRSSQFLIFDKKNHRTSYSEKYPGIISRPYFHKETQTLWTVFNKGMIKVNTLIDSFEIIQFDIFKERDLFGSGNIWCIHFWKDYLWLGSAEGLIQFDPNTNKVINRFTSDDGLPHNKIYTIESSKDNLWLGTQFGLSQFNPLTMVVKNFYVEDGLSHNEFNIRSSLAAKNGKLWFGTLNGINAFHPKDLEKRASQNANLVWTKFTTYNLKQDTIVIKHLNNDKETKSFHLKSSDKEFAIQFALLRLVDPSKNKYSWYIEGLEKPWSQTSNTPVAEYRNLAPGTYNFKVKAIDHQGNPGINELSAEITILQIWYKRWWAWMVYALIFFSGSYFFYRFRLKRKIEQQESLRLKETEELKTKLYTNITHEFRTPLTVILGMTEQLSAKSWTSKPGGFPEREIKNKLRLISRNGENLLNLINQMLDLSKLESGNMVLDLIQGDITVYINYLVESFHSLAETKNIRLHHLPEVKELVMDYSPEKLQHIISNLLSNAIKFTPEGGDIYLTLGVREQGRATGTQGKTKVFNQSKNQPAQSFLIIQVKDTGIGISPEKINSIFDRFYQVDDTYTRQGEGTGIGLTLAKELVNLMNGEIIVESNLGKGAVFSVLLPITKEAPTSIEKSDMSSNPPLVISTKQEPGLTQSLDKNTLILEGEFPVLLIVEDNEDVAHYIRTCLENDYQIVFAKNGQIGIDKAIEIIPDIIISDVMMPLKSGYELVQILKTDERTSHIPIVLLTAKADIDSKIEGLEHGVDAYLSKPFNEKELKIRLEKLLELRSRLQAKYSTSASLQTDSPNTAAPALPTPKEDVFLLKVRNIVEENIGDSDFATPHLCRSIGLSKTQLYRKLKALTDQSIALHIRSIRLQKAKELLKSTDLTVSEIAYEVGFSDPAYFSRTYSAEFGYAPNEERK